MALASLELLRDLEQVIREACIRYGRPAGKRKWGWPGGSGMVPTYEVEFSNGVISFGWKDDMPDRWWLGLNIGHPDGQIVPDFEFNIPKFGSLLRLAVQYELVAPRTIRALHTGRFTVRHAIAAQRFFAYYRSAPGPWAVVQSGHQLRLHLFEFDLDAFGRDEFQSLAEQLGLLGQFVVPYKQMIRAEQDLTR